MTSSPTSPIQLTWLGRMDYEEVLEQMRAARTRVQNGADSHILAVEHPPVFTVGRRGGDKEIMNPGGIPVVQVERGGKVTYHGPGQSVLYPIFHLERLGIGVNRYVRYLEQASIDLCATYGIEAGRDRDNPGVWVGDAKIAAIGVHVSHGVTIHGMAINVDTDLEAFSRFIPCGLPFHGITRLCDLTKEDYPSVEKTAQILAQNLCGLLERELVIAS